MRNDKIMIVDVDPIIRMNLREILLAEGYQVVGECKNGEEAVEQSLKLKPDLIIMDVKLPYLNGMKASKIIRKKIDTAIVLLTSSSHRELIENAKEAGVSAYLNKPVTEVNLIPTIEIALYQERQFQSLTRELQSLKAKLEERHLIEKAKGKVMEALLLSEEAAYRRIREYSMKNRIALAVVAGFILNKPKEFLETTLVQE